MKDKIFYNEVYSKSAEYHKEYNDFLYLPIYNEILNYLNPDSKILELCCGAGQLANLLHDNGFTKYTGLDFSNEAIKIARKFSKQKFLVKDVSKGKLNFAYDTVIAIETFEHLEYDKLIGKLKSGAKIIFSVPNFKIPSHLHVFANQEEVRKSFEPLIDIELVKTVMKIKNKEWFFSVGTIK